MLYHKTREAAKRHFTGEHTGNIESDCLDNLYATKWQAGGNKKTSFPV